MNLEIGMIEWIAIGATGVIGVLGGWFIRHGLLSRSLQQIQQQFEDQKALKLNDQHELGALRQSNLAIEDERNKYNSNIKDLENRLKKKEFDISEKSELASKMKILEKQHTDLLDQVSYFEEENQSLNQIKSDLSRSLNSLQEENEQLLEEVSRLKSKVSSLDSRRTPSPKSSRPPVARQIKTTDKKDQRRQTQKFTKRERVSTDKFASKRKVQKSERKTDRPAKKKDSSATGIRLLEEFAEEIRHTGSQD